MTCGAGVDLILEHTLKFRFKATNNQVKYEAILVGLNLAYDMGAREVTYKSHSQLVVGQINGEFELKESLLQRYYHMVSDFIARFKRVMMEHICREDNTRADTLSWLAATKKKSHQKSVERICLKNPNVGEAKGLAITRDDG